jgi:biopolymer transport protein ExbD
MKHRCHSEAEVPFPLAPMIDLTFLLLIFFMVTSRISPDSVKEIIHLPVASAGCIPQDASHRDIIDVREGNKIFVAQKAMNRANLESYLQARIQNIPARKIYLRADARTSARIIKEIISIATEAGVSQVVMGVHHQ